MSKTTKKATVKKTAVKKAEVKSAPVMEHKCACGEECPCKCHKHGTAHIVKHIIIYALIFACGIALGSYLDMGHSKHKKIAPRMHPVYQDGCLVMNSIKCPEMQKALETADVDGNSCISREEFIAVKKTMKPARDMKSNKNMRGAKKMQGPKGKKGPKGPMPQKAPESK